MRPTASDRPATVWKVLGAVALLGFVGIGPAPGQVPTFEVTGTSPAHAATAVGVTASLTVDFDGAVDPLTVSISTFTVRGQVFGLVPGVFSQPVPSRIVFDPDQAFLGGEEIEVTLTSGIQSTTGVSLTPHHLEFRVAAGGPCWVAGELAPGGDGGMIFRCDAVSLGDLDGDGDLDAYLNMSDPCLAPAPSCAMDRVLLNDGAGSFSDSGQSLAVRSEPVVRTFLRDLDADGDLDAFLVDYPWDCRVWRNDGQGSFSDTGQSVGHSPSLDADLGDLDGDGDLDALIRGPDVCEVWQNDGQGNFSDSGQRVGSPYATSITLGDLDGNGSLDVLFVHADRSEVWLSQGGGAFLNSGQVLPGAAYMRPVLGDVDADGDLDAILSPQSQEYPEDLELWINDGLGFFACRGTGVGHVGNVPVLGDLDGDGDLDLLVDDRVALRTSVLLNDGAGYFAPSGQSLRMDQYALGDLDADGDLDALDRVGVSTYLGTTGVWLNGCAAPCAIDSPEPAELVTGEFPVAFDLLAPSQDPVMATVEFSTDEGGVWWPCTPGPGCTNPVGPVTSPATDLLFVWDSLADGAGMTLLEAVDVRISVTDGAHAGGCMVSAYVDNTVGFVDAVAAADVETERGSVVGSYLDTRVQDGTHEELTEGLSGGKPANRYSVLMHTWEFQVPSGSSQAFLVDAYHSPSVDGDDFLLSYSRDNVSFTPMLTVTRTSGDDRRHCFVFPESVTGTLYIRAEDLDHVAGRQELDTLLVDQMVVRVFAGGGDVTPPDPPTGLVATPGDGQVSLDWSDSPEPDLDGYNVYRATASGGPYSRVNGALVAASYYLDTPVVNGTTYFYVVTAVDTSVNESASSDEVSATPEPGGAGTSLHVASITLAKVSAGPGAKTGQATVAIVDDLGAPVAGASVTCTFSGDLSDTVVATTDGAGVAVLTSTQTGGASLSFGLCVDDVVHATLPYVPGANVETCDTY